MNNSIVHISEIGQTDPDSGLNEGLQCVTNKRPCCKMPLYRTGEWCFPNGTKILVEGSKPRSFYRNRGDDGTVNLNRVSKNVVSPTGRFCCVVPNDANITQTLCVNIQLELTTSKS